MADLTPEEEVVRNAIKAAIESSIQVHGGFALHWTVTLESVNAEGVRGMWVLSDDECKAWDVLAHLKYGITVQEAAIHRDIFLEGNNG